MPDIFISYAHEDQAIAQRIYRDLKSEGYNAWIDCEDLLGGSNWKIEIQKVLRASNYALILLSKKSTTKRGYINKEIRAALDILEELPEADVFIIPCRLEKCEPGHQKLNDLQRVDLFPDYERGIAKLYHSFRQHELGHRNNVAPQLIQRSSRLTRLRGDSIVLPDGKQTNPLAVIASTREALYEMAKALIDKHIKRFWDVISNQHGTLIPSATLAEIIEWQTYKNLQFVRIQILEGELKGKIVWTTSFFIP